MNNVFIIFLRRPGKHDERSDPFWEFGSFGCTGCHDDNLLNPDKKHVNTGDRVAFVQGGRQGCRLVLITPPVERIEHAKKRVELRWDRAAQPLSYAVAPTIAEPGNPDVLLPELGKLVNPKRRSTAPGKLASCFRSRSQPLPAQAADEVIRLFEATSGKPGMTVPYTEVLPWPVETPLSVEERRRQYDSMLQALAGPGRPP